MMIKLFIEKFPKHVVPLQQQRSHRRKNAAAGGERGKDKAAPRGNF